MATTGVTMQPQVVQLGGAVPDYYEVAAGSVDTIGKGDLIRINDAGTIDLAEAASAGAVHGIALEDATAATTLKILRFASDTILQIQCVDSLEPEELEIGEEYTLEDGTNVWGITSTTTNGVALVVGRAGTRQPWHVARGGWDEAVGTDNNSVYVRFSDATLSAVAAAAS